MKSDETGNLQNIPAKMERIIGTAGLSVSLQPDRHKKEVPTVTVGKEGEL